SQKTESMDPDYVPSGADTESESEEEEESEEKSSSVRLVRPKRERRTKVYKEGLNPIDIEACSNVGSAVLVLCRRTLEYMDKWENAPWVNTLWSQGQGRFNQKALAQYINNQRDSKGTLKIKKNLHRMLLPLAKEQSSEDGTLFDFTGPRKTAAARIDQSSKSGHVQAWQLYLLDCVAYIRSRQNLSTQFKGRRLPPTFTLRETLTKAPQDAVVLGLASFIPSESETSLHIELIKLCPILDRVLSFIDKVISDRSGLRLSPFERQELWRLLNHPPYPCLD
ncbi:hypothetical protein KIPB_008439, partial [Kipferlia bialata]